MYIKTSIISEFYLVHRDTKVNFMWTANNHIVILYFPYVFSCFLKYSSLIPWDFGNTIKFIASFNSLYPHLDPLFLHPVHRVSLILK